MKLLLTFIFLNVLNVVIQTAKSLCTVNGGRFLASFANAVAYGLYTVVLVYMNCELSLWAKVLIVGMANFIGVWFVKNMEMKLRKDKIWKVEMTVSKVFLVEISKVLNDLDIPFNYFSTGKNYIFNVYCYTQGESKLIKELVKKYNVKYFVTESKTL